MAPINKKSKIGIIGVGYLGGAVKYWFDRENFQSFFYDKYKGVGSLQNINEAEIIFICLPTPFIKEFDDSAILEILPKINGQKIIVIRSTVLPGSTESYQKKYPQHKFLMNPEFLRAKTAIQDYLNPERQIVGFTEKSKDIAKDILAILPKAPFEKIIKVTEAELIKYFGNLFLTNKVIFANQMYDLCQKLEINYEMVKECAGADSRIGKSHLDVFTDGYRGYAGACFPKDTRAFIQFAEKLGMEPKLFKTMEEINEKLINGNKNEQC
ncbi:MAG: hypothetical protein AAB451_02820 [Patescibacteria group bacterium]